MAEPQAGENSQAQSPTNKMPWEAGFWGAVGNTIDQVKQGLGEAVKAPPKASFKPWEAGYWEGKVVPKVKTPKSDVSFKTEADMKRAVVIPPDEVMPDTRSVASNLAELDKEIANTKNPTILRILQDERKRILNAR